MAYIARCSVMENLSGKKDGENLTIGKLSDKRERNKKGKRNKNKFYSKS
jgi:hypothetical protein